MTPALRVIHVVSGDLWAGAEVQAFTLMSHLARMPETKVAAVLMNHGMLADRLSSAGVRVYVLDEQEINPLRLFGELYGALRGWRPDIVHTHRQKENILGSLVNLFYPRAPCVRTVHGATEQSASFGWRGARSRLIAGLDRWCGRALQQRIIAVTRELGVQMAGEFREDRIAVIENGVDADEVRRAKGVAEFRAAAPEAIHVGIAGRLVSVKRVDLFMEAAALLLRERPERDWRFHIFGEGPLRPHLESMSEGLNMGAEVRFHGHREDIATCVGGLTALVICSDHEGMPMVALEAAALGVPTVAHAVGGLVEVVPEEFLVSQHDAQGYRDGVLRVLREDSQAIVARRAADTLVRFSAQRNAERIRALYEQLLPERRDGHKAVG